MACTQKGTSEAEIEDLNGTWQPDWSYKASTQLPDDGKDYSTREFSWGMGRVLPNTTFDIDLGADEPEFFASGLRAFYIREVKKTGRNTITVTAFSEPGNKPVEGWAVTVVFWFLDKDRIWIDAEDFNKTGKDYGKGAVWYRLSGPQ
jgi:hypothetical protein